ncbi:ABC transporter ATP-binding protein [Pasteurella sp. PK-2025]|uniref:ABC transporter ATP-binding protein n=1 Tax=unclassified Pasteurella TaxID=2621516 RepID=UPI003C78E787
MFNQLLSLLSTKGKYNLCISALFFTFYGLSAVAILLSVFSILFNLVDEKKSANFMATFVLLFVLVIFKGICNMVADLKKHEAGFDIVQQIREKMIIKLKCFSLFFYTQERLGELNTILHKDVDNMSLIVGHLLPRMLSDFLIALCVFFGIAYLNLPLAFIMLFPLPIALGYLYYTIKQAQRIEHHTNSALNDMVSLFVEYVRGMPVLKSFSHNKRFDQDLFEKIQYFGENSKILSQFKAKQLAIFSLLIDLSYFSLLSIAGFMAINAYLSLFDFLIIVIIAKEFYKPFAGMEMHYMYYLSALDSYKRLGKILYADVIPDKITGKVPIHNHIAFEHVHFSYAKDEFQIHDLSFTIPEKTMTAFVGESGSGKTTLAHLLLRFYDVDQGKITLGGVDIREIPYDELLNRISVVLQNVQLFDQSIEENIRIGKKGASQQDIIEACKKARIHDFIMTLPQQYQTQIGENGGLLSGGQRQRLAIARAFLKDAPILILDEMTSHVDPINEALIQEAISELAKNRTVFVIAHHLKTIQHAEQILVFQHGQLVEHGNHQSLLAQQGHYSQLWYAQYASS